MKRVVPDDYSTDVLSLDLKEGVYQKTRKLPSTVFPFETFQCGVKRMNDLIFFLQVLCVSTYLTDWNYSKNNLTWFGRQKVDRYRYQCKEYKKPLVANLVNTGVYKK